MRTVDRIRYLLSLVYSAVRFVALLGLLVILVGPSIVVVLMSFTDAPFLQFPPPQWGVRHYTGLLDSNIWITAFFRSVRLAAVVSIAALVVGSLFVLGIHRSRLRSLGFLEIFMLGPLIVPGVAHAVGLFGVFAGLGLIASSMGIFLAHTVVALPFVVLILGPAISRIPIELEQAAMGLGATRSRAYFDITLRLLVPATLAALLLAFFASFDEVTLVSFLAGPGVKTLPLEIFHSLQTGLDPAISAISSILIVASAVALIAALRFRRHRG